MEEALTALLLGASGLADLVDDRIWWDRREQGSALPAISLHPVSGAPDYHMQGRSGLRQSLIQVDCVASSRTTALAVKRAVEAALDPDPQPPFRGFFIEAERSDFAPADAPPGDAQPSDLFRTSLDVRVWSSEATD